MCDCGTQRVVRGKSLRYGISKSCGCYRQDRMGDVARRHGGYGTRLYNVWDSMRQRCLNKNSQAYHNYGGRGITICKEWDTFDAFRSWALEAGYQEDAERGMFTLDRIDVNGPYAPENCRWADVREQGNNRRGTIMVTYKGEERPLKVLADELGVEYTTAWKRWKSGKPIEEVFKK